MTPEMLIAEARTWLGVPFRHHGQSRLGVDCAGWLEALIETTVGLPADYSAPRNYSRLASPALRQFVEHCRWLKLTERLWRLPGISYG